LEWFLKKLVLEIDERAGFGCVFLLELLAMKEIGWVE